jgi:class 3 adenylate cyclase/tetratricopeptide (TPR) repeat protein
MVSVLFADLVGFTPFAEERDAEDVRDTLSRYFEIASDVISRHGGIVEKFIGDAVMAVWGTRTAREDDAERAVRTGLELVVAVRGLGSGIQARAGVLTGEAAVTIGATNQGMVAGDLVNTAARLQGVAFPGTVLVGEATQRLASGSIVFEPLGEQALKGKVAPVPAWRAVRVVAERGGRGRADALEAPFIGRDEELRLLKDLYHATVREQRTRLVSVTGIGGTGKSRLAWEFEKYLDGIVGTTWWHHGRSPAYGEGITFWALGEMIRQRARLAETDDEATTRTKLAEMVDRVAADDRERQSFLSAFLALLGIEAGRADELFGAWRTFFERMTTTGPVVLVFEDLHWADSGTLDFIDHLLEWSRNVPLYIVTLARPELLDKRPTWGAGRRSFTSMFLEPLPESAVREILAGLVPGLPEPTVRAIVDRAEGIPLYAIETVRMLVDDGRLTGRDDGTYIVSGDVMELAVPPTLTALIGARLDALDAADRALVLDAAVLGQSFTVAGLEAVSGKTQASLETRLQALVRSELLQRQGDPLSPERGQYGFVQALVREVAYNTLSKKDRKNRHLAAARFFESLETDEIAGALAGHYLAAHALATAGADQEALATQARLALRGAADRAIALGAHDQAVSFFSQALSVTRDPVEEADLLERAGESAGIAARFEDADRFLRTAIDRHRQRGDLPAIARSAALLGRALLATYRVEAAMELLTGIQAEVGHLPDDPGVVALETQLARAHYINNDPRRAIESLDHALEVAERLDLVPVIAEALAIRGGALTEIGRGYEGRAAAEGAFRLAEANGLAHVALRARNVVATFLSQRDPLEAQRVYEEGMAEARRMGSRAMLVRLSENAIDNARFLGRWDWSLRELEALLSGSLGQEDRLNAEAQLAYFQAFRGELDPATIAGLRASSRGGADWSSAMDDVFGGVALAEGRFNEAATFWLRLADASPLNAPTAISMAAIASIWASDAPAAHAALERFDATGAHGPVVLARRTVTEAAIAGLEGRMDESAAGFRTGLDLLRAAGVKLEEAFAGISMASVLGPSRPEAKVAAAAAREFFVSVDAKPFVEQLDVLMASAPPSRSPIPDAAPQIA